jgi:hypothetical protein
MRILRGILTVVCLGGFCTTVRANAEFELAGVGGFAMSPDNVTLAVGLTQKPELVYIDTVAGKELKRIAVEFAPGAMAWQDKVLFVSQKTGGVVHVLDADTGKETGTATVGSTVRNLTCHPRHGLVFATNINGELWMFDARGKARQIQGGKAHVAAIDPSEGKALYIAQELRVRTDLVKFTVTDSGVRLDSTMQNACGTNLYAIFVTADGKQVGVSAGAGYDESGSRKRHYAIPMYSTADIKTMLGEVAPNGMVAAHPVLPLAVVVRMNTPPNSEGTYHIVNTKTYAEVSKNPVGKKGGNPTVLAFGGKGKKAIYGLETGKGVTTLLVLDLKLTKDEEEAVEKAFAKE